MSKEDLAISFLIFAAVEFFLQRQQSGKINVFKFNL